MYLDADTLHEFKEGYLSATGMLLDEDETAEMARRVARLALIAIRSGSPKPPDIEPSL